jgi:hypothetical protein
VRSQTTAAAAAFDRHVTASPAEVAQSLARLAEQDAVSIDLLSPQGCADLLAASAELSYRDARPVIGTGDREVHQDFEICMPVPDGSLFHDCRDALERLLDRALKVMPAPPLAAPPRLNDLVVQRYPAGSRGITAHRDHLCYRDLVAIVTLAGQARFFVSTDRSGENAREVSIPPGSVLLMRAPGFADRDDRPFHFLNDVGEERVCLGLRHDMRTEAGSG